MSISVKRKPQEFWGVMKEGLEKREWRTIFLPKHNAFLCVIRPKKKTYLRMAATYSTAKPFLTQHRRRKYPRGTYDVVVPEVQKEDNSHKNSTDNFNKMTLTYTSDAKFVSVEMAYFSFFLHALTVNAYLYWKAVTKTDADQLQFRLQILDSLYPRLVKEPARSRSFSHYPMPITNPNRTCDKWKCKRKPWRQCEVCMVSYCKTCMDELHGAA